MEKFLDRLGIYDLFVNLLTGATMLWVFGYLQNNLYKFSWTGFEYICHMETGVVLLMSYFVGIIFQESSNFFETSLYRATYDLNKGEIRYPILLGFIPSIDRILMTTDEIKKCKNVTQFLLRKKLKRVLSDFEIRTIKDDIAKSINKESKQYNEAVYYSCKEKALQNNKGDKLITDQLHASMARSLALYSLIILITSIFALIYKHGETRLEFYLLTIASIISFLLFSRRNKRFSEMRYVSVFRACLYG